MKDVMFLKERNDSFEKIYPTIQEGVYKLLNCIYPNFCKRNKENIYQEICLILLEELDKYESKNLYFKSILENNSLSLYFIYTIFNRIEEKIRKSVEIENHFLNFSYFSIDTIKINDFVRNIDPEDLIEEESDMETIIKCLIHTNFNKDYEEDPSIEDFNLILNNILKDKNLSNNVIKISDFSKIFNISEE